MVADILEITVVPDLLDWTKLKLVNVSLRLRRRPNEVDEHIELRFKPTETAEQDVEACRSRTRPRPAYTSTITYFLADGSRTTRKTSGRPPDTDGLIALPRAPA